MDVVLSAVIPTFKQAHLLYETIESVLAQSLDAIEAIVVDDGSPDGTRAVLAAYQDHPKIRIIEQVNQGAAVARNNGIAAATGRYIAMLDGDDRWDPGKVESHVAFMEAHPEIDLSYSWYREIDGQGRPYGAVRCPAGLRPSFDELFLTCLMGTASAVVFRRALVDQVGGFDAKLPYANDHEMWLRIAASRNGNIACLPEVLVDYRVWAGQKSGDWRKMRDAWELMMTKLERLYPRQSAQLEQKARALNRQFLASIALEAGDISGGRSCLAEAWRAAPFTVLCHGRLTTAAILLHDLPGGISRRLLRLIEIRRNSGT